MSKSTVSSKSNSDILAKLKQVNQDFSTLKKVIDSLPFCVKWYDPNGKLVSINRHGKDEHFLGDKTDEEIRNTTFQSNVVKEYRDLVKKGMEDAKKGVETSCEIRHLSGTAKTDWVHNTFVPVKDDDGQVKYILMISREITQEKMLQEEKEVHLKKAEETKSALYNILEDVRESEKMFHQERDRTQAIISSMGQCLVVVSNKFLIQSLNKKAADLLGVNHEAAVGQDYRELVTVVDKNGKELGVSGPLEKLFSTGEVMNFYLDDNLYYKCGNGRQFPVVGVITPLFSSDEKNAVILFQDATELKILDEAKSNFISIASHQLRSPLTSIRWYADMLLAPDSKLSKEHEDFVKRIHSSVIKLNKTINLLLIMARADSGKGGEEVEGIILKDLIKDLIEEYEPGIKSKKISVKLTIDKKIVVVADPIMLRQVIGNLFSNALRYTDINGNIEIKVEKINSEIEFSIKDDGIGIQENDKPRIFERFFRARNAVSKVPDGSGLGLTLVKSLVMSWKGKLSFNSPANWVGKDGKEFKKGTVFSFTMPVSIDKVGNSLRRSGK